MQISVERQKGWLLPLLAVVGLVKLVLLLALGPAVFPDTAGYVNLGHAILNDPSWWRDGGWSDSYAPARLLRPYGYPLLVAGLRLLAGNNVGLVIIACQSAVSVAVLALLGWLAGRLVQPPALRAGLLVLCALSGFTLFDLALLTDSFYSSLFIAVFALLAAQMLEMLPTRLSLSLLLGCAWALSITLRDVGLLHSFLPLSGVLLVGYCRRLGWRRTLTHMAAFALPVAVMTMVVVQWNLFRTHHAFFSITGGVNWLWPSVNMVDRGLADPFACADEVCQAAKSHGFGRGMIGVGDIATALWNDAHLDDPVQFGHLTFRHFLGAVSAHPLAFVISMLGNLQFGHLADLLFNPVANANELSQLHSAVGHRLIPGTREMWHALRGGAIGQLLPLLLASLLSAVSAVCLAVAIFVTPVRALRELGRDHDRRQALVALYFWTVAALFIGSYCLVHMEMRHALPTVPLILLAFGWTVSPYWRKKTPEYEASRSPSGA